MKRLIPVLSIALTFAFLVPFSVTAQHHGQRDQGMMNRSDSMPGGMMGQGMMQHMPMMQRMHVMHRRMMENPMHRAQMMTFMLPALADTLGLSDQQVEQIDRLKSEALAQRRDHRQQRTAQRKKLMGLFEGEEQPSTDAVRQRLTAMAEMCVNQQVAMYETAQQMRQVLTAEQRETLAGMSMQQRMRQMMANMPMMDMMQMMQSMCGGMMGKGMMPGGRMQNTPMMRGMHQRMMQQDGVQNMSRQQDRQNR